MEPRSETGYRSSGEATYGSSRASQEDMKILEDLQVVIRRYARERPQTLALVCLAVGFVLGWKLKPW